MKNNKEERAELIEAFEKNIKESKLLKLDAYVMLSTNVKSYYINRNLKTKNMVWCKLMTLYLLCGLYMPKKHFKEVLKVMTDKENWLERGLELLKRK